MVANSCEINHLLQVPESLRYIKNETQSGIYVVGATEFRVKDFPLVNIFHRQLGSSEEILLGILSVLFIAAISEIVQTLILRTARNNISVSWLVSAFLIDELLHFRNGYSLLQSHPRIRRHLNTVLDERRRGKEESQRVPWYQRRVTFLVFAIFISIALLSAEVVTVILTQQSQTDSGPMKYNIRGKQPIQTDANVQRYITRTTQNIPCISPVFSNSNHIRRNYALSACIIYRENPDLNRKSDVSEKITFSSFFHEAGSDHRVQMGKGSLNVSVRVTMHRQRSKGNDQYIGFDTQPDSDLEISKYLHRIVMNQVVSLSCRLENITEPVKFFESLNYTQTRVESDVPLWLSRKGQKVATNTTGLRTEWTVSLLNPYVLMKRALWPLIVSGVVEEVRGPGVYVAVTTDERSDDIPGLITEQGRIAGVYFFLTMIGATLIILIVLKCFLKPISLGYLALTSVEQEHDIDILQQHRLVNVQVAEEKFSGPVQGSDRYWGNTHVSVSVEDDERSEESTVSISEQNPPET